MPPTPTQAERIEARLVAALREPPPGGFSRTALIRSATGDYKAGAAVLDKLIAAEAVTKNADNVLVLTDNPQPEVETQVDDPPTEGSPWDEPVADLEHDVELLTARVADLTGRFKTMEQAIKQFGGQLVELAAVVGKLAEVVAALADTEADRSTPEQLRDWCCNTPMTGPHAPSCSFEPREDNPVDYAGPAVTPKGQTVLDRMTPEQRDRALEHLSKYTAAPKVEPSGPPDSFWFVGDDQHQLVTASAESFWA